MRNQIPALLAASLILLLWRSSGYCQDSSESALGDPAPESVEDPSLANSRYFPPALGTAGVAAIGPSSSAKPRPVIDCSPANPCAMATPARDRVVVTPEKL